jgi:hypothetical protein
MVKPGSASPSSARRSQPIEKAHLISVIGGDTQISAISAAISMADRFMIEGPEVPPIRVCLERNAQCFKGSLQLPGRKKPLRHLIGVSEELILVNNRPIQAGCSDKQFVWVQSPTSTGYLGFRNGGTGSKANSGVIMLSRRCWALDVIPSPSKARRSSFSTGSVGVSRAARFHFRQQPVRSGGPV